MTDPSRRQRASEVTRRATEEAASWYLDQREGLSASEQEAFLAWLRHSPLHVGEYLAMARLHGDLKAVAALDTASREQLQAMAATESTVVSLHGDVPAASTRHDEGRRSQARRRWRPWLAAASLAAMIAGGAAMYIRGTIETLGPATIYTSSATDQRSIALPDGSLVQLDRNSSIAVRFDIRHRRIEVLRGGALFDVGKDPSRPLQVTLGSNVLQDIGTVFEARRGVDGGTVTVVSGSVNVLAPAPSWTGAWGAAWDRRLGRAPDAGAVLAALGRGQRVEVNEQGTVTSAAGHVDIAEATAWLPADIDFEHSTVAEVARRFNAYTTRPLVIDDPIVAAMRITGRFHGHDVDAFVAYLQTLPGVQVLREDDHLRILAAAKATAYRHRRL